MRLHASVTIGGSRMTPRDGLQVGDLFIPGNVNMFIPPHALHLGKPLSICYHCSIHAGNETCSWHTDERYFERASEFLPERWTTASELVKDKRAFAPFTIGMSLYLLD
jgi:hypothetical protein